MSKSVLNMTPAPGERSVRFVGDTLEFCLRADPEMEPANGHRALLRTTIGRGQQRRQEIHQAHFKNVPPAGRAWRDLPMIWRDGFWSISVPLPEVGFFRTKAYLCDARGWQHWPDGDDFGVNVQPNWCRTANTIYCAFPRMFGPNKQRSNSVDEKLEANWKQLDQGGYTIIPPSGKLRDLVAELPHIFDQLACRILHLLPVSPTPTTFAKFGRFGSPYAVQDLTAVDPALVEFDRRTTGIEQFCELTDAVHLRNGRVILDLVINHTGWGSTLYEQHPEWFVKDATGKFVSPGAWGTVWEDLVEINPESTALWDELAEVFLTWCRRGVDGFRCDAGYKVPVLVWQYITARVHEEFPGTVFFLEGLGGGWEDTAIRLTEGGLQWAYSEIFQNYSSTELCGYLDHAWKQSQRVGLLINYSETHDNDRLAARGRAWSLLRNQLCALTSVSGGFGFTSGVEWLAPEKVSVHSARGLAWGNKDNLVRELGILNHLLSENACFFDGAKIVRLSEPTDEVLAFARSTVDSADCLLVLANVDLDKEHPFIWKRPTSQNPNTAVQAATIWDQFKNVSVELLTGQTCPAELSNGDSLKWSLAPGRIVCLQPASARKAVSGTAYRDARGRAAWAIQAAHSVGREHVFAEHKWEDLSDAVDRDPAKFLVQLLAPDADTFQPIVTWTEIDAHRMVPVPPGHWLFVRLPNRFQLRLTGDKRPTINATAVKAAGAWLATIPPDQAVGDADLELQVYDNTVKTIRGCVRFLRSEPEWKNELDEGDQISQRAASRTVLLTNGRGGMARMNLDLGRVSSKYDCVLGANLHARLPVDRHVLVKRLRIWANANGFISALNADNLVRFEAGPIAVWRFRVPAGDGRAVFVRLAIQMLPGKNTLQIRLARESSDAQNGVTLRLTTRFDLEDRNFHSETQRNGGSDHHFTSHTQSLDGIAGFEFRPATDRCLRVISEAGEYHAAPEWSERLPHPIEATRGQTGQGDGWSPGWFDIPLNDDGAQATIWVTAENEFPSMGTAAKSAEAKFPVTPPSAGKRTGHDDFERQLHFAASQFIVQRGDFKSVIAGYPWFLDWGRDTLICARGLIAGGWLDEVRQLLIVFGRFEENGTLPNTIHGADASNRDTSDAPLWYGVVAEELAAATNESVYNLKVDDQRTVGEVIASIATGYLRGTPNGIQVDPASALVWSPGHFTWMDTNYPAGTPREGYPIEIQALWIRVLRCLARLNAPTSGEAWGTLADRATASLDQLYWIDTSGWYADSLIAKRGLPAAKAQPDRVLRSNCLIPISFGQLTGERARLCVAAARTHLVVPGALRTLAPLPADPPLPVHGNHGGLLNDPANPYWGRYEGDEDTRRKPAYHNGTAWTWTFPIFCEALIRAHEESQSAVAAARAYLGSMDTLLHDGCFGQLPEIVDGDAPHLQRGCDAQAWGVTEALRVWDRLNRQFP